MMRTTVNNSSDLRKRRVAGIGSLESEAFVLVGVVRGPLFMQAKAIHQAFVERC
jgi:hypothetical protein